MAEAAGLPIIAAMLARKGKQVARINAKKGSPRWSGHRAHIMIDAPLHTFEFAPELD